MPAPPPAPEPAPVLSVRMSAAEKAALEARFRTDSGKATRALNHVRSLTLTRLQKDQVTAAEGFLVEGHTAFSASDLQRACTLVEKARVIAEELETALVR